MKGSIVFVPSNENHVEIFWSICKHMEDYRPVFVSQGSLKDEGADSAMWRLGIGFVELADYGGDPAEVLRKEGAGAVVVANDTDVVPQWFVNCAKEAGIPSVLVQDGILFDFKAADGLPVAMRTSSPKLLFTAMRLRARGKYRKVPYGGAGCTKILVWGQSSKSYLASKGIDEKNMTITGSPTMYAARNSKQDADRRAVLYIPTDLVHGNIVNASRARKIVEDACSAILSGNTKLTVKPHPREDSTFYEHLSDKYGNSLTVSYDNVYELMAKSGIVVTDISTTAAEALAMGKQVIIFLPGLEEIVVQSSFPRNLISENAVLYAGDEEELRRQIIGLLDGTHHTSRQAAEEMAESYFGPPEMNPPASAAEAIKSVLR
ncbi:MAG: CDP-glycerol glycerophosphotransferase family protein [Nitrososphaera sp.]